MDKLAEIPAELSLGMENSDYCNACIYKLGYATETKPSFKNAYPESQYNNNTLLDE